METIQTPKSSNIACFGWGDNGKLFVEFTSGTRWEYDAPRRVFDQMKKAKSAGSFFAAQVRGKFKGREVEAEA